VKVVYRLKLGPLGASAGHIFDTHAVFPRFPLFRAHRTLSVETFSGGFALFYVLKSVPRAGTTLKDDGFALRTLLFYCGNTTPSKQPRPIHRGD